MYGLDCFDHCFNSFKELDSISVNSEIDFEEERVETYTWAPKSNGAQKLMKNVFSTF
jgi:hypothetical protein